jgi:hypothetical protein
VELVTPFLEGLGQRRPDAASLVSTQQLQGASLQKAFVWRADARTADTADARINSVETGPKEPAASEGVVDWSIGSFNRLKERIRREVPEGAAYLAGQWKLPNLRAGALARVEQRLNPEMPLQDEKQMAEHWDKLQTLSPMPEAYEAKLAEQWQQIGCSANGAPYVVTALIGRMRFLSSPFAPGSAQVPQLAANFLKDACNGARGLSEHAKGVLEELHDRARRDR